MEGVGLLWQAGAFLLAAGAVYGGIRNDLKSMHERQNRLEEEIKCERERINECTACYGRRSTDKAE
jgi:hypothetical protein